MLKIFKFNFNNFNSNNIYILRELKKLFIENDVSTQKIVLRIHQLYNVF